MRKNIEFVGIIAFAVMVLFAGCKESDDSDSGTDPIYGISLSQTQAYTFPSATQGYDTQIPLSVLVSNSGNQATGNLSVALSGANASSFTLSTTSLASITAGGASGIFTVRPNNGLTAGTYTANVTVSGGNGISAGFDVIFTVTSSGNQTTVPTAPQNFNAIPGDGQVALSWTAPAENGGSEITGYQVSSDNGSSWVTATSNTSHTFIGLANGTSYTFKVRAVNAVGNGAEATTTAAPSASVTTPTAPYNFNATPGDEQVELSWTAPFSNGGSEITEYQVSSDNGSSWVTATSNTGHTFTGLANGTSYTFKVRAVNVAGEGVAASTSATPRTTPSAPQNFTATPGNGQVALSWMAPSDNGGSEITGYQVSSDNGSSWVTATSNTSHTFTGLANGTSYTFKVRAVNAAGNGAEATTTATTLSTVPDSKFEYYWVDEHDKLVTTNGSAITVNQGQTLTITAQDTGYVNRQWYVNGVNTGQTYGSYSFSSKAPGNYTIGLFVEKNDKLYNTNIIVTVLREVTIDMFDSDDSGWNGNGALRINVNGIDVAANVKVHTTSADNTPYGQRSTNKYTFHVARGDDVKLYWVAGFYQEENSFVVYYADTPLSPAFNAGNYDSWDGANALVYRLLGTMTGISGGTLLGQFIVP